MVECTIITMITIIIITQQILVTWATASSIKGLLYFCRVLAIVEDMASQQEILGGKRCSI